MKSPISERIFARAVRLLPQDFRDEYGADMVRTFRSQHDAARARGRMQHGAFLLRELAGLMRLVFSDRGNRECIPARPASQSGSRFDQWRRETHHAARRLRRSPGFSSAAISTLALALGANTAVFALLNGVVLADLPYPSAERLIALDHAAPGMGLPAGVGMSIGLYREYAKIPLIEAIAIYDVGQGTVSGAGDAERVKYLFTTPSLGGILGVRPSMGRWFTDSEGIAGSPPVAVLTDGFWRARFGASPSVVGTTFRLDGRSYEVVGVLPPGVAFPDAAAQFVTPLPLSRQWNRAAGFNYQGIARLKSGVTMEAARQAQNAIIADLPAKYPSDSEIADVWVGTGKLASHTELLKARMLGGSASTLWALFGAALVVLLIASANLANLVLVRGESREREVLLRQTLGANSSDLTRYFLSESLLIASAGAVLGLAFANAAVTALTRYVPFELPRVHAVHLDGLSVAFMVLATMLCSLSFAVAPLLRHLSRKSGFTPQMKLAKTVGAGPSRWRQVLIVTQVSLAVVLLAAAGLMVQSFKHLSNVDAGFNAESRLTFTVALPRREYRAAEDAATFHATLLERLRGQPGVRSVALTTTLPLDGQGLGNPIEVLGQTRRSREATPVVRYRRVTGTYFATMGMRVLKGGVPDETSARNGAHSVVVNEALARLYFGDDDPIGKQVRPLGDESSGWLTIVGVVSNTLTDNLRESAPVPQLFVSLLDSAQANLPSAHDASYVVHVTGNPLSYLPAARTALRELNANVSISDAELLSGFVSRARATLSFTMVLMVLAAVVALVLTVLGVYAVIAYSTTQRQAEFGMRLALGATPRDVMMLIMRQCSPIISSAIVLGVLVAIASARLLKASVFGVEAIDATTYVTVGLGLFGLAMLACWVPARRASRLQPLEALKHV